MDIISNSVNLYTVCNSRKLIRNNNYETPPYRWNSQSVTTFQNVIIWKLYSIKNSYYTILFWTDWNVLDFKNKKIIMSPEHCIFSIGFRSFFALTPRASYLSPSSFFHHHKLHMKIKNSWKSRVWLKSNSFQINNHLMGTREPILQSNIIRCCHWQLLIFWRGYTAHDPLLLNGYYTIPLHCVSFRM